MFLREVGSKRCFLCSIVLGAIPFVIIFALWYYSTLSVSKTISLPTAAFEGSSFDCSLNASYSSSVRCLLKDKSLLNNEVVDKVAVVDSSKVCWPCFKPVKCGSDHIVILPPGFVSSVSEDKKSFSYTFSDVGSRAISPQILPSPSECWLAFMGLLKAKTVSVSLLLTLARLSAAFLTALILAFPAAFAVSCYGSLRALFMPMVLILRRVPLTALLPVCCMLFVENGELTGFVFITISVFSLLIPGIISIIDSVDDKYLKAGISIGASRVQLMKKILAPIVFPKSFVHIRNIFAAGWSLTILAETASRGSLYGIGSMLFDSFMKSNTAEVYAVAVLTVILAFVSDVLLKIFGECIFAKRVRSYE